MFFLRSYILLNANVEFLNIFSHYTHIIYYRIIIRKAKEEKWIKLYYNYTKLIVKVTALKNSK